MKAPMPQTLRHHQDPLVFLHQTNVLRQQGLDPGGRWAARGAGRQRRAGPAGPCGQQVPGGSSGWKAGSIPRATLSLQRSPEDAHPEDAHPSGVSGLGTARQGGMQAGTGSLRSGGEAPR